MRYLSPWIHTTNRCNCRCSYCFVEKKHEDMSSAIYRRINEYFIIAVKSGKLQYVKYRMAGGEPLLAIDNWYHYADWFLHDIGDHGGIEVLSNFTIYPKDIDVLCKYHANFNVNVSLDSVTRSKPFLNGKSSAKTAMANIKRYRKLHGKRVFIMTVITDNGDHLPALAEYVVSIGAKWEIQTNKYYEASFSADKVNANMKMVYEIFHKAKYDIGNILFNFCDMSTERQCENGYSMFAIMPDGTMTNCQMQNEVIGNVNDDMIAILERNNTRKINTVSRCRKCIIKKYCHGDCPYKSTESRRLDYICRTMKHHVLNALKEELHA